MERNEKACEGDRVLEDGDMVECLACGLAVRHDLVGHPFFGFESGCPMERIVSREGNG